MTDADGIWRDHHRVRSFEMDASGRLSAPALCNLLQEAAGASASSMGFSVEHLFPQGLTWVLARLRIRMARWPAWRDEVTIETWPSGAENLRAYREFVIVDRTGARLGAATSLWMVIDLATRRPTGVPEFVRRLRLPRPDRELPGTLETLHRPERVDQQQGFRVRWGDVDLNRHANSTCYIEWALETVPTALRDAAPPSELDVDFRAEALLGEEIVAEGAGAEAAGGGQVFSHRVVRPADNRELAVLRSAWPPPSSH